jgi:hypothetical protein
MAYSWLAVDALTGRIITDMPGITCDKVGATLGDFWTGAANLSVAGAPPDWLRATAPWSTYLVLLDDEQPDPVWGGWIAYRSRSASDTVLLTISTWEAYLARRFVRDLVYTGTEQCALAAHMVGQCVTSAAPPQSVPPALIVETTPGSTLRDRTYESASDKTVLAALQELSGVDGGPEWTVTWRHLTGPERYVPVLTIADRIGVSPPAGLAPAATFEMPGPVVDFQLIEDWSTDAAANNVIATSTAEGDVRPQSSPHIYPDPVRPTLEYRWTPSTSITNVATLDAHAAAAVAVMCDGGTALTVTAAKQDAPVLGVEWRIGDDIGYRIQSPAVGLLEGVARAIGWEAVTQGVETVSPILASEEDL